MVRPDHNEVLAELVNKHFENRPMAYISNRVLPYAVDPFVYKETAKIENLKAFAIITQNTNYKKNAEYEHSFFEKPFEIFNNTGDAVTWAHSILKTHE